MGAPNVTSDAVASLPPALRLVFDPGVRRRGETLIGGTPLRVLRLTPAGCHALLALQQGTDTSATGRALGRRLLDAGIAHPRLQRRERVTDVTVVVPVRDRPRELE